MSPQPPSESGRRGCENSFHSLQMELLRSTLTCLFKDFIYLFMRDTQREAETQAEGEAGSLQGS